MKFRREAKSRPWLVDDDEGGDAAHRRRRATQRGAGCRKMPADLKPQWKCREDCWRER